MRFATDTVFLLYTAYSLHPIIIQLNVERQCVFALRVKIVLAHSHYIISRTEQCQQDIIHHTSTFCKQNLTRLRLTTIHIDRNDLPGLVANCGTYCLPKKKATTKRCSSISSTTFTSSYCMFEHS